jgi:hypothetical protein
LIAANDALRSGVWYHIACVFDLNGTNRLFINGIEPSYQTNTQGGGAIQGNAGDSITIGGVGGTLSFNGLIDDARVYNRALTPEEVQRLYRMGN